MVKGLLVKNYLRVRSALYVAESIPIINLQKWISDSFRTYKVGLKDIKVLQQEVKKLFDDDAKNFSEGLYPIELLAPESPLKHSKRFVEIFTDNIAVTWRKRGKQNKKFSKIASKDLLRVPEYYRRNFHFQTDGYLSQDSAELYDHQVEILFKGTAHSMRRMIVPLLIKHLKTDTPEILELASGTGNATQAVAASLPKASITCLDLSDAYLKKAQKNLKCFKNINFIRAQAEDMPFKDQTFDIVFSVFLFHEVPEKVREAILSEAHRVLKKGGLFVFMDSIQLDDNATLNWALIDFPKNFHEPFYKNYISTPIEEVLEAKNFQIIESKLAFLSKVIVAEKI